MSIVGESGKVFIEGADMGIVPDIGMPEISLWQQACLS